MYLTTLFKPNGLVSHYLPFTFFSFGFFDLADGLAFRVAFARIAPADSLLYPDFWIFDWIALKPGCFAAMFTSVHFLDSYFLVFLAFFGFGLVFFP
jgi:hypothetical protein